MGTFQTDVCLSVKPIVTGATEDDKLIFKLSVTLAADKGNVDPVVEGILQMVSHMPCAHGKEDAIHVALSEALANAVVHGAHSDPSKKIECDISCDRRRGIVIVVRDPGRGFDHTAIPNPIKGKHVFSEHGRGIYLINQLMDEVKFLKNGSEIHMIKR
jgi:serine/threonine-protein kinase RsbW